MEARRLIAGLLALAACKSDPPAPPAEVEPKAEDAPAPKTAEPSAARGGGEASACVVPTWAESSPCRADDTALAAGDGRTVVIAGEVARGALARALAGSSAAGLYAEVPATLSLCGRAYAVARLELPRGADVELEECGAAFPDQPELEDPECPEWTGRVAWIDGEDHHGVGSSELTDEALAAGAARGKAEAEVRRLLASSDALAKANGDDRKVRSDKLEPETARCGTTTYVRATTRREVGR